MLIRSDGVLCVATGYGEELKMPQWHRPGHQIYHANHAVFVFGTNTEYIYVFICTSKTIDDIMRITAYTRLYLGPLYY